MSKRALPTAWAEERRWHRNHRPHGPWWSCSLGDKRDLVCSELVHRAVGEHNRLLILNKVKGCLLEARLCELGEIALGKGAQPVPVRVRMEARGSVSVWLV